MAAMPIRVEGSRLCGRKESGMESVGQEGGDVVEMVYRTFLACENDFYGVAELLLVFEERLAAAATRGDRLFERFVRVDGGDDNLVEGDFRV